MIRNYVKNKVANARAKSQDGSPRVDLSQEGSPQVDSVSEAILNENVVSNTTYVYLSNLSHVCTEFELFELFTKYGEITRILIIHPHDQESGKGTLMGIVGFSSRFNAEDAMVYLQPCILQGNPIGMSLQKPDEIDAEAFNLLPPNRSRTKEAESLSPDPTSSNEDHRESKGSFSSVSSSGASTPAVDEVKSVSVVEEAKNVHPPLDPVSVPTEEAKSATQSPAPAATATATAPPKRRSFFSFGRSPAVEVSPPPKTVTSIKNTPVSSSPDTKHASLDSLAMSTTPTANSHSTSAAATSAGPSSAANSLVSSAHSGSHTNQSGTYSTDGKNTEWGTSSHQTPGPGSVADTNSVADVSEVATDDGGFVMEYEEEDDNKSVAGSEMGETRSGHASPARRSFFGGFGGRSGSVAEPSHAAPPVSSSSTSYAGTRAQAEAHADPTLKVMDPILVTIGKKIRELEKECAKQDDEEAKEWKKNVKPHLEAQIADLDKKIKAVTGRIETEINHGLEHIAKLEEELRVFQERQDELKRKLYFPTSVYAVGQGGVYIGMDDVWLEHVSGHVNIELIPDKTHPKIDLVLNGARNNAAEGFKVRVKIEGFKLAGDKGMNVPKINFDNLKITIALSVTISLVFDVATQKWLCPSKNFKIEVISFKGPYGINRSMVSLVLSLVSPMIRKELLNNLPHEFGLLIRTFPSPFTARGEIDIMGTDLQMLATELHKTTIVGELCEYSPTQVSMFYWLQKAIDRATILKTLSDIIIYRRVLSKNKWNKDRFEAILILWQQAANIYSDKVVAAKMTKLEMTTITSAQVSLMSIKSEVFFKACDDLMRKRLCADIKLQYVDGQISLNHILNFTHQLMFRIANDSLAKANALQRVRLVSFLERLTQSHQIGKDNLKIIAKNIDFAQLTIQANLHSGPAGVFKISLSDILAQAPVLLMLTVSKDKSLGALPLVPYIISFKPQESGDVHLEIYHFTHQVEDQSENGEGFTPAGQNLLNSTGKFSNSYNKAMNSVSVFNSNAALAAMMRDRSGSVASSSSSSSNPLMRPSTLPVNNLAHLLVKHDLLLEQLKETLRAAPKGNQADSILVVVATSPHISMIVDKSITLKPGTELFTLLIGPQKKGWKPFGTENMFEQSEREEQQMALEREMAKKSEFGLSSKEDPGGDGEDVEDDDEDGEASTAAPTPQKPAEPGCPMFMQTAPGIKMLTQIPRAVVGVDLAALMRFILAHFSDLHELKLYLESFFGGEFYVEQLEMAEKILGKVVKYLLLPGVDMDINVNGKIVSLGHEIMVRLETPEELDDLANHADNGHRRKRGSEDGPCAIKFRAEINLQDLFNDSMDIDSYVKKSMKDEST